MQSRPCSLIWTPKSSARFECDKGIYQGYCQYIQVLLVYPVKRDCSYYCAACRENNIIVFVPRSNIPQVNVNFCEIHTTENNYGTVIHKTIVYALLPEAMYMLRSL